MALDTEERRTQREIFRRVRDEHNETLRRWVMAGTPTWFTWLEWFALAGGLAYLHEKTQNPILSALREISFLLLWLYFAFVVIEAVPPLPSAIRKSKNRFARLCLAVLAAVIAGAAMVGMVCS